jgi:UDP-perosamine 4-acetyltransferase
MLKQGLTITNNVTIGMGAVVTKNIVKSGVYIGNPAKELIK